MWLLEDGLADGDWDGWVALTERLGETTELVSDDIFVTNPATIAEAIEKKVGNAALIKLYQIGTVSERLEAMGLCRANGYATFVSHRSGETPDTSVADLTVGTGAGHLKTGAPARGERVAKDNRLMEIAAASPDLPYGWADGTGWAGPRVPAHPSASRPSGCGQRSGGVPCDQVMEPTRALPEPQAG